jgi:PAS domain-containing protein
MTGSAYGADAETETNFEAISVTRKRAKDPSAANSLHSIEEAVGAFSLLREFFEGAIIVDAQSRITWIDARYRELLKLSPDFDPLGLPIEEVIPIP